MALDPNALGAALAQVDIQLINQKYIERCDTSTLEDSTLESIQERAQGYATAIHTWILTATVNTNVTTTSTTNHVPGAIAVTGTAVAQANPAPVVGTATGSGTGVGTLS